MDLKQSSQLSMVLQLSFTCVCYELISSTKKTEQESKAGLALTTRFAGGRSGDMQSKASQFKISGYHKPFSG